MDFATWWANYLADRGWNRMFERRAEQAAHAAWQAATQETLRVLVEKEK